MLPVGYLTKLRVDPEKSLKNVIILGCAVNIRHYQDENLGTLAQLVEQRTFNPFVVGSTPARPTKISLGS